MLILKFERLIVFLVMNQLRDGPTAHAHSLPASQQNNEDTDETSADSRYHSDQGSGAQVWLSPMSCYNIICSGLCFVRVVAVNEISS